MIKVSQGFDEGRPARPAASIDNAPCFDPMPLILLLVYFMGPMQFGVSFWKSVVIAILVAIAVAVPFGRRVFSHLGVVLLVATLLEWSGATPPLLQWPSILASLINRTA